MRQIICDFLSAMVVFAIFSCQHVTASDRLLPLPEQPMASSSSQCINISGMYQFTGVPLPQSPPSFRGLPFTMDVLTGQDLPYEDRLKVTHIKIEQQKDTILSLTFYDQHSLVEVTSLSPSADTKITCDGRVLKINQENLETKGEAVQGEVDITKEFSIAEDGSLTLHATYNGIDKYFFSLIRRKYSEEYAVKFGRFEK